MLSLDCYGLSLLFVTILTGVSCEELTPVKNEESSLEDSTVTLSYTYSEKPTATDYFFWYQQYPGKPPEFIISHLGTGGILNHAISRLNIEVDQNQKQIHLNISSAAVSDSAVYYCAVQNTGGGGVNKMIFGSGTRLTVEPKEVYKPSFYKLSDDETTACLATGFSQLWAANNTHNDIFEKTSAVRIGDDSLFNEVALLSKDDKDKCQRAEDGAAPELCEDTLEPDAKVNLMSLTILGLRLLFLKTIVFNVLLTLRLWISH